MSLTGIQRDALIRPIAQARVSRDGKGFSHVEAYDVRRRLIEIFDFAGWSGEVIDMTLIFEDNEQRTKFDKKTKQPILDSEYTAWTVCYRATYELRIHGTAATYSESATGEATNQPSRGDAHDLAIKTAESQAFKRAAMNLGSQFGLSLYAKGSTAPIVRHILVNDLMRIDANSGEITRKDGGQHSDVDTKDHVTEAVTPETDESTPAAPRPFTAELDEQQAARRGVTPEQERHDRLVEGATRRDALGVKSDGKVRDNEPNFTRSTGPDPNDPWAGRAKDYNDPTQADLDYMRTAGDDDPAYPEQRAIDV